jgi:ABC-type enterochelin transport system substrate-binding protein
MEDGFVVTRMRDAATDTDVIIYEGGDELYHKNSAIRDARELAGIFYKEPAIEQEILDALDAHRQKLREEYKDDKTMMLMIG